MAVDLEPTPRRARERAIARTVCGGHLWRLRRPGPPEADPGALPARLRAAAPRAVCRRRLRAHPDDPGGLPRVGPEGARRGPPVSAVAQLRGGAPLLPRAL